MLFSGQILHDAVCRMLASGLSLKDAVSGQFSQYSVAGCCLRMLLAEAVICFMIIFSERCVQDVSITVLFAVYCLRAAACRMLSAVCCLMNADCILIARCCVQGAVRRMLLEGCCFQIAV